MSALYLIRHTQPDIQPGICYGQSDIGLKASASQEIDLIKNRLKDNQFGRVYSSPLKRCAILAEALTPKNRIVIYDERLMELDFGEWELKSWKEIELDERVNAWFDDYIHVACPSGEAYIHLMARVKSFLHDLAQKNEAQPTLIVTHGGVIKTFHAVLNAKSLKNAMDVEVGYGEVVKMEMDFEKLRLKS